MYDNLLRGGGGQEQVILSKSHASHKQLLPLPTPYFKLFYETCLTLPGPGFEKLAQTWGGGADSAPLYSNQTKFGVGKYNHMISPGYLDVLSL